MLHQSERRSGLGSAVELGASCKSSLLPCTWFGRDLCDGHHDLRRSTEALTLPYLFRVVLGRPYISPSGLNVTTWAPLKIHPAMSGRSPTRKPAPGSQSRELVALPDARRVNYADISRAFSSGSLGSDFVAISSTRGDPWMS